jgi:hypothetical protein
MFPVQTVQGQKSSPGHQTSVDALPDGDGLEHKDRDLSQNDQSLKPLLWISLILLVTNKDPLFFEIAHFVDHTQVVPPKEPIVVLLCQLDFLDELWQELNEAAQLGHLLPVGFHDVGVEVSLVAQVGHAEGGAAVDLRTVEGVLLVQEDVENVEVEVLVSHLLVDLLCLNFELNRVR